ncbi:MAG: MFS transporter [Gaiellales bacterium]
MEWAGGSLRGDLRRDRAPELTRAPDTPDLSLDIEALQRRTLRVVFLCQGLGGAGLAAGVTVGALLAKEMLGSEQAAGLPVALFTLGSALAAWLVGRSAHRHGRRVGLSAGFIVGGIGAIGVVLAAMLQSVTLLFIALFIYGSGTATNLQARYAGTDLAAPERRGRAISIAMVATTLGAVLGPNLVEPTGRVAEAFGITALAGPFMLAAVAYVGAGLVLAAWLRPDPLLIARALEAAEVAPDEGRIAPLVDAATAAGAAAEAPAHGRRFNLVLLGAALMLLSQLVMVAIMTMTPVHMDHHARDLGDVGMVIGVHIGAMFLPSPLTGMLVDLLGRTVMTVAAVLTLLGSGLMAAFVPGDSLLWMMIALALLGLGWNFGIITGTALIVDGAEPASRARTQGSVDVLIALAGATGGGLSAVVMSGTSFAVLSVGSGLLALVVIPVLLWALAAARR